MAPFTGSSPALGSIIVRTDDGTYIGKIDGVLGNTDNPVAHIAHLDRKINPESFIGCEAQIRAKTHRHENSNRQDGNQGHRDRNRLSDNRGRNQRPERDNHQRSRWRDDRREYSRDNRRDSFRKDSNRRDSNRQNPSRGRFRIEILGDFLAETEEEEIVPLLTTIGHAISVIMSTSHLEKNAIDAGNPNRPNLRDRENSTGIKIRKRSGITEMMARIENSAKQEVNPPTMPTTGGLSLSMHALAREIAMIK